MGPVRRRRRPSKARRVLNGYRDASIYSLGALFAVGLVCGGLFFLRPSVSEVEHRELTRFPSLDLPTFLDGTFFSNVALWYADTYPLRDPLVGFDQSLQALYGFSGEARMKGGNVQADELPVAGETPVQDEGAADRRDVEPPDPGELQTEMRNQIMNGLYVEDGTAYSLYYFDQGATRAYADAINEAAKSLEGTSTVYSILAPTNAGVLLSDELQSSLGATNQEQASDYFYSLMDDSVKTVPVYQPLKDHEDEYLYFRTDHHWTALGAYYAYRSFCEQKGIEPEDLDTFQRMRQKGFLGTFYSELQDPSLASAPDVVSAYLPHATNEMTYWDSSGTEQEGNVVNDLSGWIPSSYYSMFILGDQPLSQIDNPKLDDGSSVLLVKDSFGCAFAPWLVDHYQTTYIIDFRAYDGSITDFAREHDVDDVIFLNCLSLAGTYGTADTIMSKVQAASPAATTER